MDSNPRPGASPSLNPWDVTVAVPMGVTLRTGSDTQPLPPSVSGGGRPCTASSG